VPVAGDPLSRQVDWRSDTPTEHGPKGRAQCCGVSDGRMTCSLTAGGCVAAAGGLDPIEGNSATKALSAAPRSQSGSRRSDNVRHLLVRVHEDAAQRLPVRRRCSQIQLPGSMAPYAGSSVVGSSASRRMGMVRTPEPALSRSYKSTADH
jgi:hypothetical protein